MLRQKQVGVQEVEPEGFHSELNSMDALAQVLVRGLEGKGRVVRIDTPMSKSGGMCNM